MTENEAIEIIKRALKKTIKEDIEISLDTDFFEEEILDSLDSLMFFHELEKLSGLRFPQKDLVDLGFLKVDKIVDYMKNGSVKS